MLFFLKSLSCVLHRHNEFIPKGAEVAQSVKRLGIGWTTVGSTQPPIQLALGALSPGVEWLGRGDARFKENVDLHIHFPIRNHDSA
jgi:hypothetical protein